MAEVKLSIKTVSEEVFEEFCSVNGIKCEKISVSNAKNTKSPDYLVTINSIEIIFEIKQLDKDIRRADGSWCFVPGSEIRTVISKANGQVRNSLS